MFITIKHLFVLVMFILLDSIDPTMSSIFTNYPRFGENLTEVTWAHAVNSQQLLNDALQSPIMMLEADIVLGTLTGQPEQKPFPIMAHPPQTISDISLENFLRQVLAFNAQQTFLENKKGIKLDFKSIEAFESSVNILTTLYDQMSFPVWLNADILPGPVESPVTPVNAQRFLASSKQFVRSVLSIGWTTRYGVNVSRGEYTERHIQNMLDVLQENNVTQEITFPVRAGLAAQSREMLEKLISNVQRSTFTVWSSEMDPVDVEQLRRVIFSVGLNRVYVDVPENLRKQLRLDYPPTK